MSLHTLVQYIVLSMLFACISACSSSSTEEDAGTIVNNSQTAEPPSTSDSDTPLQGDEPTAENGIQHEQSGGSPDITNEEIIDDTNPGGSPDENTGTTPNENSGTNSDENTSTVPDENTGSAPDENSSTTPDENSGTNSDESADSTPESSGSAGLQQGVDVLIPAVISGSDLDRLISGITRQAGITLLDLNRRFAQGESFSQLEEKCLGAYEPQLGNPLFAIDCSPDTGADNDDDTSPDYLATDDIAVYVQEAAFYPTAQCAASLANQRSDNCILRRASLMMRSEFIVPEGASRPVPEFPGATLNYAIDDMSLRINNLSSALSGAFACNINLQTAERSEPVDVGSCANTVTMMAEHLEKLQTATDSSASTVHVKPQAIR